MDVAGHCLQMQAQVADDAASGTAGAGSGSEQTGSGTSPSTSGTNSVGTGAGGSPAANGATAGRSSSAGRAGSSTGTAGGTANSGAGASSSQANEPTNTPQGVCDGHANESVCEGEVLHRCDAQGVSSSPETCASAMLCQTGVASAACAVCSPGTFRCTEAELEGCNDSGQYQHAETCASASLCNESAGMCTAMVCKPDAKSCGADGTLQTCNADGSAFVGAGEACGRDMCDARALRCLKCVPSPNTCSGNMVVGCSSDGQTETRMACSGALPQCSGGRCVACLTANDCKSTNECVTPACNTTTHTCGAGSPKPSKTPCTGGKVCDGAGTCTTCGNGADDAGESCEFGGVWTYAAGTCDPKTCVLTDAVYGVCQMAVDNGAAYCPVNGPYWFCSPHGACSLGCSVDADCRTTTNKGTCLAFGSDAFCVIRASDGCPPGLRSVDVSGLGISQRLCGTVDRPVAP